MARRSKLLSSPVELKIPIGRSFVDVMATLGESMGRAAGLGQHARNRVRLISEEIFMYVVERAEAVNNTETLVVVLQIVPSGLSLSFKSSFLIFDPGALPEYSMDVMLEDDDAIMLRMHLLKNCAEKISLVKNGVNRELTVVMNRREAENGTRSWSRLIPSLSPGLLVTPVEHEGKRLHRLDMEKNGRSFLVRSLAHHLLTMIDGKQSFAGIMAKTLQIIPDSDQSQIEELFEAFIERGLVDTEEMQIPEVEMEILGDGDDKATRAIEAYKRQR